MTLLYRFSAGSHHLSGQEFPFLFDIFVFPAAFNIISDLECSFNVILIKAGCCFLCFLMHSLGHSTNITTSCFKFVSLQNFSFIQELKAKSKTSSQISPRQNPSSIFICESATYMLTYQLTEVHYLQ